MTVNPIPPGPQAVVPVIDYEPPARAVAHCRPPAPARPRCAHPPRPRPDRPLLTALSPAVRAAATFADAALRRVLEVIDRRRPVAQLYPLLAAGLVDSVLSAHPTHPAGTGRTGAATLQRVRPQAVGSDDPPTAVEVFGTYRRGRRIHAVACRVERVPVGPGWRVVALHIG